MKVKRALAISVVVILAAAAIPSPKSDAVMTPREPTISAASPEAAGRYLVRVGGCNDCHTPGFAMLGEKVPEAQWLIGTPVGFKGPWGTTYAQNLRRFVQPFTADQFVEVVRKRNSRPPMPWSQLHAMSDQDLKAVYAYLKSLGNTHGLGQPAADWVPPDREPKTPFIWMVPQNLPASAQQASTASEASQASQALPGQGR